MECIRITIDMKNINDIYVIRPLGDIHLGDTNCDVNKLKSVVDEISEMKNVIVIGMGDYIDGINPSALWADKRLDPYTIKRDLLTAEEQTDGIIDILKPIKDKIVVMIEGNHEWKIMNEHRFKKDFCRPLDAKYGGKICYISLSFKYKGKEVNHFLIHAKHAGFSGAKAGGALNNMEDAGADWEYDIQLMGHNHGTFVSTSQRIGYDRKHNGLIEKKQIHGNTGTFLRSYKEGTSNYIEMKPSKAKRVGTIAITLDPKNGDMFGHD